MEPKRARVEAEYPEARKAKALNLLTLSGYNEGLQARVSKSIAAESRTGQDIDAMVYVALKKLSEQPVQKMRYLAYDATQSPALRDLYLRLLKTWQTPDISDKLQDPTVTARMIQFADDELFDAYKARVPVVQDTQVLKRELYYEYQLKNPEVYSRLVKRAVEAYKLYYPFFFGEYLNFNNPAVNSEFFNSLSENDLEVALFSLEDYNGPAIVPAAQLLAKSTRRKQLEVNALTYFISIANPSLVKVFLDFGADPLAIFSYGYHTYDARNGFRIRNVNQGKAVRALFVYGIDRASPKYTEVVNLLRAKVPADKQLEFTEPQNTYPILF